MIHYNIDNLHDLNCRLTEENQKLQLQVHSLQRQLENITTHLTSLQGVQQQLHQAQSLITSLRRDNLNLQECLENKQQLQGDVTINNGELFHSQLISIQTSYEQKLNVMHKENKRLHKLIKEIQQSQTNTLENSTIKLFELTNKLEHRLDNNNINNNNITGSQNHIQRISPKGLSKKIYDNLIQQLSNKTLEEPSYRRAMQNVASEQIRTKKQIPALKSSTKLNGNSVTNLPNLTNNNNSNK